MQVCPPHESGAVLRMLCKNLEDPGFTLGCGSSFVLEGSLIISSTGQYNRVEMETFVNVTICNIWYHLKLTSSCSGISSLVDDGKLKLTRRQPSSSSKALFWVVIPLSQDCIKGFFRILFPTLMSVCRGGPMSDGSRGGTEGT